MCTQRFSVLYNSGKMDFFNNTTNYLQDIQEKIIKTDEVLKLLDGKKKDLHKLDKKYKKLLEKFWVKNNELSNINTSWEKKVEVLKTENEELIKKHYNHVNEAEKKYQLSYLELSELTKTCDNLKKKLEKSEQKDKNNLNTKKLQDTLNETKEQLKESIRKYEELETSTNQIISELKNESKNHVEKKNETLKQLAKARLDCDDLKKSLNLRTNSPTKNKLKEEVKELESKLENAEIEIDLLNQSYKNDVEELKKKHGQEIAKLKSKLVIEATEETTRKHKEEKKILEDQIEKLRRKLAENDEKHKCEKNTLENQIIKLKKIIEKDRNTSSTQTDFEDIFNLDDILIDAQILPMLTPMSLDDECSLASEICEDTEPQKDIEEREEQQKPQIEEREQQQQEIEEGEQPQQEIEDTCAQNLIKVRSSSELYSEIQVEAEIHLMESSTQTEDQESMEFKFQPSIILPKNNILKNIPRNIKLKSRVTKKYKNNKNKMLSAMKSSNLNIKNLMQNYLDTNNKIVIMSPSILNQNFDRANFPYNCQSQFHPFGQNLPCFSSFYNTHNCSSSRQFNHRNLVNSSESEDDIRDFLKDYKYRIINKYLSKNNWRRPKTVINKYKYKNIKLDKKRRNTKKRLILSSESSESSDSESNDEKFNNKKQTFVKTSKYKRIVSETESSDSENNKNINKKAQNNNSCKLSEKRNCFNKSKTNPKKSANRTIKNKKNNETVLSNSKSSSENKNTTNIEITKTKTYKNTKQTKSKNIKSKEIISESEIFTSDSENISRTEQNKNRKTTKTMTAKFITPPTSITDKEEEEPEKIDDGAETEDDEKEALIENDNQDNVESEGEARRKEDTNDEKIWETPNVKNAKNTEVTTKNNKINNENQPENNEILLKIDEILNNSFASSGEEEFKGFESPNKTKINKNCEVINNQHQSLKQNEENKENITKNTVEKKSQNYLSMNKRQQTILRKFAFKNKISSSQIKKDTNPPISLQNNKRKPEKISFTPTKRMKLLLFGEESNSDSDESNCSLGETQNTTIPKTLKNIDDDIKINESNERISFVEENNLNRNEIISVPNEILETNLKINEPSTTVEKEKVFKRPERSKLICPIKKQMLNKDPPNISCQEELVEHIIYNPLERPTSIETENSVQTPQRNKLISRKKQIVNNVLPNIAEQDPFDILERSSTDNKEIGLAEKLVLDVATLNWDEPLIITTANYLSEKDPEIVARVILKQAVKDFSQQFDKTFTPPAPLLTPIQQKILVLVNEIEQKSPDFHTVFLEALEKRLLSEKRVEVVHSLTRIYVTQRKLKYEIEQVRMLCCHAAYYMGDLVLPLVYIILTSWAEVLPKADSAEDLPLVIALVHVIQLKSCREPGFNYRNLTQLLKSYYEYRILENSNEQIMNKLVNLYSASYSNSAYTSILIICRNLPPKWTYTQIKNNLLPLLAKNEKKEMTISLINRLMENFSVSIFSEQEYFSDIKSHLEK